MGRRVGWILASATIAVAGLAVTTVPASSAQAGSAPAAKTAFVRFGPKAGRLRILVSRLEGDTPRALALPVHDALGPAWSPDGRRIAFVGGRRAAEGTYLATDVDLYVAGADGRHARRITRDGLREAAPAWSPGGATLVFARSARTGNRSTLWIASARGSGARRLTPGPVDLQPSWSPNGKQIVFVRITATNESQIWLVRPDGSGPRRILAGLVGATQPAWSPDGRRLLLTDGATLFTIGPDGSGRRLVTRLTTDARGGRVDPQPTWSRSGWIAFAQLRPGTLQRSDIWRVRPNGEGLERLTRSPGLDSEPSMSP